jgi:PAS domain S-box-containing protein
MTEFPVFDCGGEHTFEDLSWQDHVCLVYDDISEWIQALSRFLKVGLRNGEQCICLSPAGVFSSSTYLSRNDVLLFQRALKDGRLIHWDDAGALERLLTEKGFLKLPAVRGAASNFPEVRVVCDMAWLGKCGVRETVKSDFLLWMNKERQNCALQVLNGFPRRETPSAELRRIFGMHRYICHAGHLLPGGFHGGSGAVPGRRTQKAVPGWRHTFRRGQVLDAIFEAAPFAIWMLDQNKDVVFVNRHLCEILGMPEEQILGKGQQILKQRLGKGGSAVFALDDPPAYESAGPLEREQTFSHVDGNLHDYRVVRTKVVGNDGQVQGLLGLAIDITDRKKAERLLKEGEKRFRDIALSIGDLIWEVGPDWRFRYLSERASSVLGCDADRLIGRSPAELDDAAAEETWHVLFEEWDKAPKVFRNVEKWLQHKDGRQRCLLLSGTPIINEDGLAAGFRGVAEDITERKQQEDSLKRALWEAEDGREKIDNIIRSITDALVVLDEAGQVVLLNPQAEKLFGKPAEHAVGSSFHDLCPAGEVRDTLLELLDNVEAGECEACLPWPSDHKEKQAFFKARASCMANIQGGRTGAIFIFTDMTREREMERVKTEFISTAAHELRTPLTSIMGYLEFCMHPEEFGGFPEAQLKEFMTEIYDKAEVLERIVSDLLDISRIEAGREIPLVMESVNVFEINRRVLQHFQLQFPRYRFEMDFASDVSHKVRADREKLVQVMENLVSNAVKYSREGSAVRVTGGREPDCYRISVKDKGIGMTSEQIERMFDRFYRAVDLNSGVRGLGLGMHIVKYIIERHGGSIEVVSAPGAGTEIVFDLPLSD